MHVLFQKGQRLLPYVCATRRRRRMDQRQRVADCSVELVTLGSQLLLSTLWGLGILAVFSYLGVRVYRRT